MEFDKKDLEISDLDKVVDDLSNFIQSQTFEHFRKNGIVIGISGGIDSAVAASLAAKTIGSDKVLGLILPEKESNPESKLLAEKLAKSLKIETKTIDLTPILQSFNIYEIRESIVKKYFKTFNQNSKYRLVTQSKIDSNQMSIPYLEIFDNDQISKYKLSSTDYSTMTAATSLKLRSRMTMLYYYAEKNNYLVLGTTNKSELDVGNFVKYGDGGVDIEPLSYFYKTQIFQLAKHLNIIPEIIQRKASPDTWSFETTDEEFFYGMTYEKFDLLLYSIENNISAQIVSNILDLPLEQTELSLKNIRRKIKNSENKRNMPPQWKSNKSK